MHLSPEIGTLAGRAGRVGVALKPSPVRGDLTAIAITRPAELCLRHRGVEFSDSGAYVNNGTLFCQFTTADLGTALPAVRAYFDEIGCRNFASVGYQLADRFEWHDFNLEQRGSYCAIEKWTWRDRLRPRWQRFTNSRRFGRLRTWCFHQRAFGNLHRALHAAAVLCAGSALVGYLYDPLFAVTNWLLSVLAAVASHLARPLLPRETVERMLAEDMDDARAERAEFIRSLKAAQKGLPPDA